MGGAIIKNQSYGPKNDEEIELQRPVAQVIEVKINPGLHLFERVGLAALSVYLRPTRDSRSDFMANHVTFYDFSVQLVVSHGMRPRTDDAHATLQDVYKLRQLIK